MKVNEIFLSIQGEGFRAGRLSVFVRLAGCNLRCRWCDTAYALDGRVGRELSVEEVVGRVRQFHCPEVVVTGGEPMLSPDLPELLLNLKKQDIFITLETNGTVYRPLVCDLLSLSPKLANSTPYDGPYADYAQTHEKTRLNIEAIRRLMDNHDYQLKFVVTEENDLREIQAVMEQLPRLDRSRVLLMPQARTRKDYRRQAPRIAALCIDSGLHYSPRLHLELWGRRRGK